MSCEYVYLDVDALLLNQNEPLNDNPKLLNWLRNKVCKMKVDALYKDRLPNYVIVYMDLEDYEDYATLEIGSGQNIIKDNCDRTYSYVWSKYVKPIDYLDVI